MNSIIITYNDNSHEAVMNLNTIRKFSRLKGYKTVNEFADSFQNVDENDLSFQQLDDFGLLFLCAFQEGARLNKSECLLTIEDVVLILQDQKEELIALVNQRLDEDDEGNPKPPAKVPAHQ